MRSNRKKTLQITIESPEKTGYKNPVTTPRTVMREKLRRPTIAVGFNFDVSSCLLFSLTSRSSPITAPRPKPTRRVNASDARSITSILAHLHEYAKIDI